MQRLITKTRRTRRDLFERELQDDTTIHGLRLKNQLFLDDEVDALSRDESTSIANAHSSAQLSMNRQTDADCGLCELLQVSGQRRPSTCETHCFVLVVSS